MTPPPRYLLVTLDTEVDKSPSWRISNPASFDSICLGIPQVLSPLFEEFGVVPTYLLSGEVMEDPASVSVLRGLGARAELGTHLHGDFVPPQRRLHRGNMDGRAADAVQFEYPREVEEAKLVAITDQFLSTFGYRPTSFRAGRFALSSWTFELLAQLGYRVDSSVTPGLRWRFPQGTLDYVGWGSAPRWQTTAGGDILEIPVGVQVPNPALANVVDRLPGRLRSVGRRIAGARVRAAWLRPSWASGSDLVDYLERTPDRLLVLMFHTMEIIPGASPYAAAEEDVERLIAALRHTFEYCARQGIGFCSLSQAVLKE